MEFQRLKRTLGHDQQAVKSFTKAFEQAMATLSGVNDEYAPHIVIANIEGALELRAALMNTPELDSYTIEIVNKKGSDDVQEEFTTAEQEVIWVGSQFPPMIAYEIIRISRKHIQSLNYIGVTSDLLNIPSAIHHRMLIGAETRIAANRAHLTQWRNQLPYSEQEWVASFHVGS